MPLAPTPALNALIEYVKNRHASAEAQQLVTFAKYQYQSVADDDLSEKSLESVYRSLISQWTLLAQRKPNEIVCRVQNIPGNLPLENAHTVIELCQTDRPFLVDSLIVELNRLNIDIHLIIHSGRLPVKRDAKGAFICIYPEIPKDLSGIYLESVIYAEIDPQTEDSETLDTLKHLVLKVMTEVQLVTDDFIPMRQKLSADIAHLSQNPCQLETDLLSEHLAFLRWLQGDHFTFLGYLRLQVLSNASFHELKTLPNTALGLLREAFWVQKEFALEQLNDIQTQLFSSIPLMIAKSEHISTVHRTAQFDVILVKQFESHRVTALNCYIGLYTSSAYNDSITRIPLLRHKAEYVLERSGYAANAHDGKTLFNVLNTFPRDELFQISQEELFEMSIRIMQIQERQRLRLFVRRETFNRYVYCMVFIPKDLYTNELCLKMQAILKAGLEGSHVRYSPLFLESALCRIDYLISVNPKKPLKTDTKTLEKQLTEAARTWKQNLKIQLLSTYGDVQGFNYYRRYSQAFRAGYQEDHTPEQAVRDISAIERLYEQERPLEMYFYTHPKTGSLHLKLFHLHQVVPLTTTLPLLENMGLKVMDEKPYALIPIPSSSELLSIESKPNGYFKDENLNYDARALTVWVSDFTVQTQTALDLTTLSPLFQEAIQRIWRNQADNDGFNRLVLLAGLSWREVIVLRALAKYLLQTGFRYSQPYIEQALTEHPEITRTLVDYFKTKFDPAGDASQREKQLCNLHNALEAELQKVTNLDQDRILRRYFHAIAALLRTNYFQHSPLSDQGAPEFKPYVSFKFSPAQIPDLPKPIPRFEVFVFSTAMEGVHLRMSNVARGGIRWSDRFEDFRTEILSLMKAQQVKNAVIVPMGAKGGFISKLPGSTREETQQNAIASYQTLVKGLLDLTDNVAQGQIIPPSQLLAYDDPDPYLVVAADKGTATFSDIANKISADYGFWMGDAFASGGSNGYDHKKIGITARGAFESVKRHFAALGRDVDKDPFTVVGIGDMSGDVFGNGLLLSKQIRLVGAFNHQHIFIDPSPDAEKSFIERQRLFQLPRSTWQDYSPTLISEGGGIFDRQAKSITLSPQMKALLGVELESLEPAMLIQALLKCEVDLIWNGGIGTYIKSSTESNIDVGDRQNDPLRINGADLRCKVIAEGGNLGLTQRGRIEAALLGVRLNTDTIDNSGGVDCSDHEVNIKILLNAIVQQGELSVDDRNLLLAEMQEEVATLVLKNNYDQNQIIQNGLIENKGLEDVYVRLIQELKNTVNLDRRVEMLPTDEEIIARKLNGKGLTAPEFSILLAYTKLMIRKDILDTPLPDDPHFTHYLEAEFPRVLSQKYPQALKQHRLARDIVATQVCNSIVKYMGMTFVQRLLDETGTTTDRIIYAFEAMSQLFCLPTLWANIEKLDRQIPSETQVKLMMALRQSIRHSTTWLLTHPQALNDLPTWIQQFSPHLAKLRTFHLSLLSPEEKKQRQALVNEYHAQGVPKSLASQIVGFDSAYAAFDIIQISLNDEKPLENVAKAYWQIGEQLSLKWLRQALSNTTGSSDYFGALSISALQADLNDAQATLTRHILKINSPDPMPAWTQQNRFTLERWQKRIDGFQHIQLDTNKAVALLRALGDMVKGTEI